MKYVLDTNVYIGACRSEESKKRFQMTFFPLLPATYFSAVVAYELFVDAQDSPTRILLADFLRPLERAGRIVSPAFDDWVQASRVVTGIEERDKSWRSKLPALMNDVLIALSARRIGAMLLTYNGEDFRMIRRHMEFSLRILQSTQ